MRTHILWPIGLLVPLAALTLAAQMTNKTSRAAEAGDSAHPVARDVRKRSATVGIGDLKAAAYDYWRPTPVLGRYRLLGRQEYDADGEILIQQLGPTASAAEVFAALKKQMQPSANNAPVAALESEFRKEQPTITKLVLRHGTFIGDDGAKLISRARLVAAVVETSGSKYLVRLVGPRDMVVLVQPDFERFLSQLKK